MDQHQYCEASKSPAWILQPASTLQSANHASSLYSVRTFTIWQFLDDPTSLDKESNEEWKSKVIILQAKANTKTASS